MMVSQRVVAAVLMLTAAFGPVVAAQDAESKEDPIQSFFDKLDTEYHGFYEVRSGYRLQNDRNEKDM